jgi:protein involved in polysaccharide export with SLBB domain
MNNTLNTGSSLGFAEVSAMRKKLTLLIIVIGLLAAGEIRAQQPAPNASTAGAPDLKRCVEVFGAVRAPARIALRRRVHLAEVIAMAGGQTDRASGTVRVIHSGTDCSQPGNPVVNRGDPAPKFDTYVLSELLRREERANPYVEDGDIVIVTPFETIYVAGSVVTPRAIYLKGPVTLMQAIALAGGELRNAQTSIIVIHRQKKDVGDLSIQVDPMAIRKHRVEDPILQPNDVVVVPSLGWRIVGPPIGYPTFDPRPLIPPPYPRYLQSTHLQQFSL